MRTKKKRIALLEIVGIVFSLYVLVFVNYMHRQFPLWPAYFQHDVPDEFSSHSNSTDFISSHFREFKQALAARADADRYIILVMTDEAFIDMAINFYEASLRAQQIDNFLFVGIGSNACKILTNMLIPCFFYAEDPSADKASAYGEQEFKRKMNLRTCMILEALAENFTVIHTDTDVAFLSSPVHQLKVNDIIMLLKYM